MFLALPLGVGRKAHPSSPAASSSTAAGTSEEEGLHAYPLPHISRWPSTSSPGTSEEEGLAPSPFLLTMSMSTLEEEGQGLLLTTWLCTSEEEGQALLLDTRTR